MANDAKSLINARVSKNDEFYTQLTDIEKELSHYKEHFKNKVVLCNCDDPRISNFYKYFANNFEKLGLKKLITTCYKNRNPDLFTNYDSDKAIYIEYTGDTNGNRKPDPDEDKIVELVGDGDFRSPECIKFLEQADIVCTNPPFSLFREYIDQLTQYKKKFIIIGNINSITFKDVFQLVKENKMWLGHSIHSGDREFRVPSNYPLNATGSRVDEKGNKYIRVKGVRWFTNLDYKERHENLILYKNYNSQEYPKYDDFDAIEVGKVKDIPIDYKGIMGVPITFLDKYNPEQFEIVGMIAPGKNNKNYLCEPLINGVYKYRRLAIIKKGN